MENLIENFEGSLSKLSDQALVDRFNQEVGKNGWVSARAYFLVALTNQFTSRGIDFSIIRHRDGISLANTVRLISGKLVY